MAQEFVTDSIKGDKVVVFLKPSCPYCVMAKDVLSKYGLKSGHLEFIDITGRDDMNEIQDYLNKMTGERTVSECIFVSLCYPAISRLLLVCPPQKEPYKTFISYMATLQST
uniref:Glutaredoxin-1 n=1 Tax=Oncorhynchus tshawytscha TaxID=74940 RepID=A0AAZ3P3C4_ONCTS